MVQFPCTNNSLKQLEIPEQIIVNFSAGLFRADMGKVLVSKGGLGICEGLWRGGRKSVEVCISSFVSSIKSLIKKSI